jgi:hypothetical protein
MLLCGWQLGTLENSCFNLAKEHGLPQVQAIATGLASTPGGLTESGDGQAHSTLDTFAMPSMSRNRVYSLGNVLCTIVFMMQGGMKINPLTIFGDNGLCVVRNCLGIIARYT